MSYTTNPQDPRLHRGVDTEVTPVHEVYLVLSEEERAKGFIRPLRRSYVHVGQPVPNTGTFVPLEEAVKNESDFTKEHFTRAKGYVGYIQYPESESPVAGRYIKQDEFVAFNNRHSHMGGCGTVTTMGVPLAETWARDIHFYGSTYCGGCRKHLPVGEFVWDGTNEVLGT